MRAIYTVCDNADLALGAVNSLRQAGIADRDITIMSSDPVEGHELTSQDSATLMPWIAAFGGLCGLTTAVGLALLTERSWPMVVGNMPIVAWWPNLIIMFELTMLGSIAATVITLLVTAGIPSRRPKLYDPEVADGKILVGVRNPAEASVASLERALQAGGGRLKTV